ncbi:adenylate/guanylate cyclase domain-containing protein [Bradyrhizobium sp. AZCC 2289]|uniref:adenylate/guanylate cyclase domain-containing protein n=1 Tax=Bradyrhizobium sp. AZCC 2289 TaxID=3117026 RepID=UPI002FEF4025
MGIWSSMVGNRVARRLAAVLAADIAGYSRLMGADEVGTLAALKAIRREIVDPAITEHKGRIVKTTGDGMLVEFASAVDAVTCAMQIQDKLPARNVHATEKIMFRIGINVGDVIIDGDDIFGDGVNVAARVEAECEPGGVCLSANAYEQIRSKTSFSFDDMGEKQLKNIERPVRVYFVRVSQPKVDPKSGERPTIIGSQDVGKPLTLPDKPSIAVLPFQNMSGDPEQEYFADGMVEDIITGLSRSTSLFVIARNSSFAYKGKAVDIKVVGRELGVRYVLEGSVRKSGNRLRITGQLIDTDTGIHIWADRFDGGIDDLFELQDQVTGNVVGAIWPKLELAEIERSRRKPTQNLRAYDYYLRAISHLYRFEKEANERALEQLNQAINLDPEFALAYAQAANSYAQRKVMRWNADPASEAREAERLARTALNLAKDDPAVLAHCGMTLAFVARHLEEGAAYLAKGTDIDPNFAPGWYWRGWVQLYLGEAGAIGFFSRAIRLSPLDSRIVIAHTGLAYCYFFAGQYEEALSWAKTALRESPKYVSALRVAVASQALLGNLVEAKATFARAMELDPNQRIANIGDSPFRRDEDVTKLAQGFRLAGMPE